MSIPAPGGSVEVTEACRWTLRYGVVVAAVGLARLITALIPLLAQETHFLLFLAHNVRVSLGYRNGSMKVEIVDDGAGSIRSLQVPA